MTRTSTPLVQMVPVARPEPDAAVPDEVRRAAAGDTVATAAVLRRVKPGIVAVVRRILGASQADVDDAVQQSLIAFTFALPAFRGDSDPRAYAKTIAVRTALALRRRMQVTTRQTDGERDASALPSDRPSPNDMAAAQQRRALLRQLLGEIPVEQAEALAMRVVLGWSLDEIAQHASIPPNTVRSRIRLAKEALRKRIEAAPELRSVLDPGECSDREDR